MALRYLEDAGLTTYRSRHIVSSLPRIYLRADEGGYAYYLRFDVENALQKIQLDFPPRVRGGTPQK